MSIGDMDCLGIYLGTLTMYGLTAILVQRPISSASMAFRTDTDILLSPLPLLTANYAVFSADLGILTSKNLLTS